MYRALVNGCFDGLHEGHKWFLDFALTNCDALWVLLNSDSSVRNLKGDDRPLNLFDERAKALGTFIRPYNKCSTINITNGLDDENHLMRMIAPDAIFKSVEHRSYFKHPLGGRVIWVPRIPGFSTSEIAKRA